MSSEDSSAGPRIGRTLELARKERGLTLKQVEQATKIRARYLEEFERDNFGVLPAVYARGSLKTYANFLHLDGEALVRELRRQQASHSEQQDPTHVEPPRRDYFDRSLIFLGGAADAGSRGERAEDEEGDGEASAPLGGNLIYLASAACLVLILAVIALALTLPRESQPELSQIREPVISGAPSQMAGVQGEENPPARPQQAAGEQRTDDENEDRQLEKRAGAQDDGEPAQTGEDEAQLAQGSTAATATPSASPTPQAEPPPAQPAAAPTQPRAPSGGRAAGAPVGGAAPQPAARGTGGPANAPTGPRGGGAFNVQIAPGSGDLVRITGSPVND